MKHPTPFSPPALAIDSYPPPPPSPTPAEQHEYERGRWNYFLLDAAWRRTRFNPNPNTLLVETVRELRPGLALDVNMGEGRNALFLAQQGWRVTGVDYADQALAYARQRAAQSGLTLNTVASELAAYNWGTEQWNLLVLCYADEQAHAERAYTALRPGGLVVFENFHADVNQTRSIPAGQEIGFATDELRHRYAAAGFEILHYEELIAIADFSLETQRLVRLVAQKR